MIYATKHILIEILVRLPCNEIDKDFAIFVPPFQTGKNEVIMAKTIRRKFPIGIQSFKSLRQDNYLYVDKTALVYELANSGKPFFLSRPRRFGKSLLLSTLEAYFRGQKELFKGLAIEELEEEWLTYPVLHLDLNARKYSTSQDLDAILNQYLESWEKLYGTEKQDRAPEERFMYQIQRAAELTGHPVVVLVDEYDKPLLQSLQDKELHQAYKETLKAFYGVLKSADQYLKFYLLTGVTKFGQVSVFSDLNQLKDISMDPHYNTLCGLTWQEIADNFQPELQLLGERNDLSPDEVRETMTRQYDGYHFMYGEEGIFNPFSVLNVLSDATFDDYWFKTGTPTFLIELLKKTDYDLRNLEGIQLDVNSFADYRADASRPIPVIYQSGYLTIKGYDKRFRLYTLGFPNDEVKYGFLNFITPFYSSVPAKDSAFYIGKFVNELESGDVNAFTTRLRAFFAGIPYELKDKTERHYQVIFYLVFRLMGQFTEAEVRNCKGRADAVVKTPDYIYVFEFKLEGTAEEALAQIDDKGYLIPYTTDGKQLVKVGANFSAKERNLEKWISIS